MEITHRIQQLLLGDQSNLISNQETASTGSIVVVAGWVKSRRDSKGGFSFIQINDGSGLSDLQVIADATLKDYETVVLSLTAGCAVKVLGDTKPGKGKQTIELHAHQIWLLGGIQDPSTYPIAKKRHSFEFLREVAHLRPRTNTFGAVARVRHATAKAIHDFFDQQGFVWVNTPIITANDCEGAGELFKVSTLDFHNIPRLNAGIDYKQDFFDQPTYLTVSGQLNVEAFCLALSKVYTFGPSFRAENSHTSRHLAEFWMVEPEIAFADLSHVGSLAETFLVTVVRQVLDNCGQDLSFFDQRIQNGLVARLEDLATKAFERISYTEAIDLLKQAKHTFEFPVEWGMDLQSEHERYLSEVHVKSPVILYDYPKDIKAFYMRENDDGRTCAALDLLAPGIGEIIGGSQREERFDRLEAKLVDHGLNNSLGWYQDLRKYGTVPHGGFGLGFERLLNYLTGLDNIRDVIPFPRTPGNASF